MRQSRLYSRGWFCALNVSISAAWCFNVTFAHAQQETPVVVAPKVEVLGIEPRRSGTEVIQDPAAGPASVTVITKRDIDRKTVTTYGDIFRNVPGFSILEYGQGLVAYDVQLRGFDGGHGRNLAVYLDGVPLNITGSQHTNGYMDLAQLIPELISRVEVTRGPFSVLAGNHAVAGSVQFYTDATPRPSVKFTMDNFGRARLVPITKFDAGPGSMLVALDLTKGSAYTKQSDLQRYNFFSRYVMPLGNGVAALRFQAYDADAEAPGYIDRDKAKSGEIDKRGFLNRGIGDAKSQQNLVFNYRSDDEEGVGGWDTGWFFSAYFVNDIRKRWSFFNLSVPLESSQDISQERDRLKQTGLEARKTTSFQTLGMPSQVLAGIQYNNEDLQARNFGTDSNRNQLAAFVPGVDTIGVDRKVRTQTQSAFAQYQIAPIPRLKLTAGGRYDRLVFDIGLRPDDNLFGQSAVPDNLNQTAAQFSPKIGATFSVYQREQYGVEVFANAARGLKSPYPFSDFYSNTGVNGTIPDLRVSRMRSYEVGFKGGQSDGSTTWRVSYWDTQQDRESGPSAAGAGALFLDFKKTDRDGFDIEGTTLIGESTRLYANYSRVKARIKDPINVGEDRIPNVADYVGTVGVLGLISFGSHELDWNLAIQRVGPQALLPDNSVRTRAYGRYTGRLAYGHSSWKGAKAFLSFVAYDKQFEELTFDFGGGLFGTSPRPRRQAILGVQIPFGDAK